MIQLDNLIGCVTSSKLNRPPTPYHYLSSHLKLRSFFGHMTCKAPVSHHRLATTINQENVGVLFYKYRFRDHVTLQLFGWNHICDQDGRREMWLGWMVFICDTGFSFRRHDNIDRLHKAPSLRPAQGNSDLHSAYSSVRLGTFFE